MPSKWKNEQALRDWKDIMCAKKCETVQGGVCNKYCDSDCLYHWNTIEYETLNIGE